MNKKNRKKSKLFQSRKERGIAGAAMQRAGRDFEKRRDPVLVTRVSERTNRALAYGLAEQERPADACAGTRGPEEADSRRRDTRVLMKDIARGWLDRFCRHSAGSDDERQKAARATTTRRGDTVRVAHGSSGSTCPLPISPAVVSTSRHFACKIFILFLTPCSDSSRRTDGASSSCAYSKLRSMPRSLFLHLFPRQAL